MLRDFTKTMDASFLEGVTLPPFVKVADIVPPAGAERIGDSGYGLIVTAMDGNQPLYPIYDKQRTYLSAMDLSKNYEGMPKIAAAIAARSILGAAERFDIDTPPILRKIAAAAEPTGRYYHYLTQDSPLFLNAPTGHDKEASVSVNGEVYTIRNPVELSEAEQWFDRNHFKLAQDEKYVIGQFLGERRNVLADDAKLASEGGGAIHRSEEVTKVASYNEISPDFEKNMYQRASMCADPAICRDYVAMAMNKSAAAVMGPAALVKWAFDMDVRSNLIGSYGRWIPEAIDACLVHKKTAEEISAEEDRTKKIVIKQGAFGWDDLEVPQGQLKTAIMKVCSRMLGKPIAEKIAANPNAHFGELPDGVRDMVVAEAMRVAR